MKLRNDGLFFFFLMVGQSPIIPIAKDGINVQTTALVWMQGTYTHATRPNQETQSLAYCKRDS